VLDGDSSPSTAATGEVMLGEVPTIQPELSGDFATLMGWADEVAQLKVRANAETPLDARAARRSAPRASASAAPSTCSSTADRIIAMREMIMAERDGRRAALAKILPMQRADFVELFGIMKGLPVTIRLLDPPLHEFLPNTEAEMAEVAKAAGLAPDAVAAPGGDAARGQPDARPSRLPARHHLPRDLRDAGARHLRGGGLGAARHRRDGRAGNHDPAGRLGQGAVDPEGPGRPHRQGGGGRDRQSSSTTLSAR
jgi:phosphoenolpyruvate synthase/pyruvate phosphate dikinase